MISLDTNNRFEEFIKNNEAALIYFSTDQCNVCKILKPKVIELIRAEFSKIKMAYVNSEKLPEVAAQNGVFSVPTILLYINGNEFIRKSRNINLSEFRSEIERPYFLYFQRE